MTIPVPTAAYLEQVLSDAFATPVSIAAAERIEPWAVLRCRLNGPGKGVPSSVIVKWLREDPNGFRTDPTQMQTERAALEFLEGLGVRLAPRLLSAGPEPAILILEDLAPRAALDGVLRGADPAEGLRGLSTFARTLGELHAGTAGQADPYYARRIALGAVDPGAERMRFLGTGWPETRHLVLEMGISMHRPAEQEMAALEQALDEPGPFLALSNGDAEANNFLLSGDDGRIVDFEFAGFRHALTDVTCFYVPGPMWITLSDAFSDAVERVYREAVSAGVPEALDDGAFGYGLSVACLAKALERLHRLPRLDDRLAGDPSRRQMVSTLECAAAVAERHRVLPGIAGWTRRVADTLRRRWPDADVDFAAYASYTPR